eukprot:COSAG05_NODE_3979_length_1741_cov_2.844702_3_plen_55_part_01
MPAQAVRDVIAEFEPAASMLNSGGNELNNSKEGVHARSGLSCYGEHNHTKIAPLP